MITSRPLLLIGIGNRLRRDDGAGVAVIRQLGKLCHYPNISILEHHGEGLSLIESWQNYPGVIIVDATRSDKSPGTVQRFVVNSDTALPRELFNYSSHLFGLAEAVALAQSLNRLPQQMEVFGIEGKDFSYGEELTIEVKQTVYQLAERINAELR